MNGEHDALVLFAAPWWHSKRAYPEFEKVAATFADRWGYHSASGQMRRQPWQAGMVSLAFRHLGTPETFTWS